MSEVILDTITGKSTATTITIGSTPVVSASANSMTIRGEGSNQTSIQQGIAKVWTLWNASGTPAHRDSFNAGSITDHGTGERVLWMSRGSLVLTSRLPPDRSIRRNNQVLSAAEELQHAEEVVGSQRKGSKRIRSLATKINCKVFLFRFHLCARGSAWSEARPPRTTKGT